MKKIAIVCQRYGVEVNGGAEQHARMLAERLSKLPEYNIEVLTTCALDYVTWENHYPKGVGQVNGVWVRRFAVKKQRNRFRFKIITRLTFYLARFLPVSGGKWVDAQGPYCPKCIEYIKKNRDNFDVFIFVTYLYYLTVRGISEVADKALFIPTAHDELPIYLKIYQQVFQSPKAIAYNSAEERRFLLSLFDIKHIPGDIVGVGVETPHGISPKRFQNKYNITGNYILYVGRIDEAKNCRELFDYFVKYKAQNPSDLKLVLMGKEIMPVPEHSDIIPLGFVSDEDKSDGMAGARLLILPSFQESLSLVVIESMSLGVPVVVSDKCSVLRAHCDRSGAGLYYSDYDEFESCINRLFKNNDEYTDMQAKAKEYVEQNYHWDAVMGRLTALIEMI